MSELQTIETALEGAARRRRWERAWRGLWHGLLVAGLVGLLALAIYKFFPVPLWTLAAAAIVGGATTLAGFAYGWCRQPTLLATARWVDEKQKLEERLSTALEVARSPTAGTWRNLLLADAALYAGKLDPRQLLPWHLPTVSRWALLVLVLCAGLGFVPEYRSPEFVQKQRVAENIRQTGKQLAELTRRNLQTRPPVLEPTQKAMESVAEVGMQLNKNPVTRSEALHDLANVAEKLNQQLKDLDKNPALKQMERAARDSGGSGATTPGELQKQIESLQKSLGNAGGKPDALDKLKKDLEKAQQAAAGMPNSDSAAGAAAREQMAKNLADLARQARETGINLPSLDEAIAALQSGEMGQFVRDLQSSSADLEKLRDMAKAMQQLQQQAAKLGKDLGEQLKNSQIEAAQATLQKMIEQLKSANLTSEQLQKIREEVSKAVEPGSQYGKVADYLKLAVQQMQQGQKPEAAQSLAAAAKELQDLMQQMGDLQSLAATLEALGRAEMAIASGRSWSQCKAGNCSKCNGQGCSACRGWREGGRPGAAGVGTWAEETGWLQYPDDRSALVDNSGVERPDMDGRGISDRGEGKMSENTAPTKVKGKFTPGAPMPSITLKGVSIRGQSTVQFQEAATAAQTEAQSALNQDQVPRAYQGAVRDYFDDLKK